MIWMILGSIVASLAGLGIYIYYLYQGQFEEDEEVKYQLFREENPES